MNASRLLCFAIFALHIGITSCDRHRQSESDLNESLMALTVVPDSSQSSKKYAKFTLLFPESMRGTVVNLKYGRKIKILEFESKSTIIIYLRKPLQFSKLKDSVELEDNEIEKIVSLRIEAPDDPSDLLKKRSVPMKAAPDTKEKVLFSRK